MAYTKYWSIQAASALIRNNIIERDTTLPGGNDINRYYYSTVRPAWREILSGILMVAGIYVGEEAR